MKIDRLFKVEGYGAVVTGGASGLGLAFAEALAENGANVTLLDVDARRVEEETARLRGSGFSARGEVVDVRDPEGALEAYTDERWSRVIDINLNGIFATLRSAARIMKPQRSGRLIVTSSVASYQCEPAIGSAYMAAKAGVTHLMRCVAQELAAFNITCNAIAPGFFITNIGGGHAQNPAVQEAMAKVIPMHRVGFPDDIKGLALFLASPASAYLTGQQISIDGGWTLGAPD
jgi:NAD(P)-dependent dehydrogenase (short-subunit alcohol dehydrogenase family)